MKKILFILPNLSSGGAERVSITYIRQLDPNKYDVCLAVFDKTSDLIDFVPDWVRLVDLRTRSTKNSLFPLANLLRSFEPDIVYTCHFRTATLVMAIRPFAKKFRHLARAINTPSLEKRYGEYGAITRWLYTLGMKSADVVIAETDDMKDDIVNIFRVSPSKIIVKHNPIDTKYINEMAKSEAPPFPEDKIVAVASGRIDRQKGFDVLLKAVARIVSNYPHFILYILGNKGREAAYISSMIKEYSIEKNVFLAGYQKNPYCYYANCDMFILSSRWEGFPNVFIENYYLNTPIVATKCVPIIEQMIVEGKNGFLCEAEDPDCLARKIVQCMELKRENINNRYSGSKLEDLF